MILAPFLFEKLRASVGDVTRTIGFLVNTIQIILLILKCPCFACNGKIFNRILFVMTQIMIMLRFSVMAKYFDIAEVSRPNVTLILCIVVIQSMISSALIIYQIENWAFKVVLVILNQVFQIFALIRVLETFETFSLND